jgi:multiple sugar transport system permease protein
MAVSLALALLLNQKVWGLPLFRTFFYIPSIVPVIASSILWIAILNPQSGLINTLLGLLGLPQPGWLASETWSKPALIVMSVWGSGGSMIIYLAALQGVPEHLYEAAEVDGATPWRKFWSITLPLLTPTTLFLLIIGVIGAFQYFTQAYVMTDGTGGPVNSTLFYALYLFLNAFSYYKMGLASAMAWILFFIVFVATLLIMYSSTRWVHYEAEA